MIVRDFLLIQDRNIQIIRIQFLVGTVENPSLRVCEITYSLVRLELSEGVLHKGIAHNHIEKTDMLHFLIIQGPGQNVAVPLGPAIHFIHHIPAASSSCRKHFLLVLFHKRNRPGIIAYPINFSVPVNNCPCSYPIRRIHIGGQPFFDQLLFSFRQLFPGQQLHNIIIVGKK